MQRRQPGANDAPSTAATPPPPPPPPPPTLSSDYAKLRNFFCFTQSTSFIFSRLVLFLSLFSLLIELFTNRGPTLPWKNQWSHCAAFSFKRGKKYDSAERKSFPWKKEKKILGKKKKDPFTSSSGSRTGVCCPMRGRKTEKSTDK